MSDSPSVPVFRASSAAIGGRGSLDLFKTSTGDIFNTRLAERGSTDDFRLDLSAAHLGRVLVSEVRASALTFERDRRLVATAGIDHILVQLYTEGGFSGLIGGVDVRVRAGDICILDMTRTLETKAGDFANITLVLPRALLAEAVVDVDRLHGVVLRREEPLTRILAAHARTLVDQASLLPLDDAEIVGRGTIALIARLLERRSGETATSNVAVTPLRRILDHIDANLDNPKLGPGHLIERFGLSRATLYRMFRGVGGVAEVIRLRRLNGAAMELASAAAHDRRISEIARDWGFADDSSFGRAFRAHYGITPTEARIQSSEIWQKVRDWKAGDDADQEGAEISFWLRTLRV